MANRVLNFKWSWTGEFAIRVAMLARVNINLRDVVGRTALMRATELGAYRLVKELLAKNADINIQDDYGYTALMIASVDGYTKIIKRLLGKGADIDLRNIYGLTATIIAIANGNPEITNLFEIEKTRRSIIS